MTIAFAAAWLEVTEYWAVTVLMEEEELVIVSAPVIVLPVVRVVDSTYAPVVTWLIPPVPASISIPPAVLEALITTAFAALRSELSSIFLATSKSIPSVPLTVITCFPVTVFASSPTIVSVLLTPTSRVLFLLTLISIPPADAVSSRALATEVPEEARTREESVAPVTETVKS